MISFHYLLSDTYKETGLFRSITYASNHTIDGPIVKDTIATSSEETLRAENFQFIV